jgi:peptidyl-dipeptidase A
MHRLRSLSITLCGLIVLGAGTLPRVSASEEVTMKAKKFVEVHTAKLRPLEVASNLAWWNANISGKAEDFQKKAEAQNRVDEALANPEAFKEIQQLKKDVKEIDDAVIARCVEVLYLTYLEKQVDIKLLKEMVDVSNKVEKAFNEFRADVDGKKVTDNVVRDIL